MTSRPTKTDRRTRPVARIIRERVEKGGERLWCFDDFRDLPFTAVAQTLSRLARAGELERLSKGVYYRGRETAFGRSRPNPAAMHAIAAKRKKVFTAGTGAANLLGFTTQTAGRRELATSAPSLPRKLVGQDAVVHARRPEAWARLSEFEAALLDFLRNGGRATELSPEATIRRTLKLLREDERYRRLLSVAETEPPRVRAMLGALGEQLNRPGRELDRLRESLNPLSRFSFGVFTALDNARSWQAKQS